ncbi:MAG: DUF3943 domain-containing protein [Ignavibacteriae bacterium]|nr:DUF3943 domain-containing protein [Ignavibacteriota bacterium]
MKKIITLLILFCFYSSAIFGQDIEFLNSDEDTVKYHPEINSYFKKSSIIIPISEIAGMNSGLCLFNRFVSQENFAKISFSSVANNFKKGFVWDNDFFVVNQFAHPYHGNIYFNTARSNGYSFWESVPFTLGGSLMWEMFMETDPPQTNDLVSTTLGGVMLGEITYRLSSLILDESKRGFERTSREILGAVINPARGFNRLIRGDINRHTKYNVNDVYPFTSKLNIGYAEINPRKKFSFEKNNYLAELSVIYFKNLSSNDYKPFDVFRLKLGIDAQEEDTPSSWVDVYGILYGKRLITLKDKVLVLGLFQDFDFYNNSIYKLGAQSAGPGIIMKIPVTKKINFAANVHANLIILSALNSIYRGENRDYDFLMGSKILTEGILDVGPFSLQIEYKFYWMKSINGIEGKHTMGILNPKLFLNIYKGLGAGAEYLFYHRHSVYKNIETTNLNLTEHRFYVSYWL